MARHIDHTLIIKISGSPGDFSLEAYCKSIWIEVKRTQFLWNPNKEQIRIINDLNKNPLKVSHEDIINLGQMMFRSIFTPSIYDAFVLLREKLENDYGLRIKLVISAPDLAELPWELMHDGNQFISSRSNYPFVRATNSSKQKQKTISIIGKIRVLYVWAEPQDLPKLENLELASIKIKEILRKESAKIQFDVLPNASIEEFQRMLDKDYHVIIFAGHGKNSSSICFESGFEHKEISVNKLIQMLEGKNYTRLIFLAACETSNFAKELSEQNQIPAVIAMQYEIENDEGNQLVARFLESLSNFRPVDSALAEARKSILQNDDKRIKKRIDDSGLKTRNAFAPILYLQSENSNLFRRGHNWAAIILALFTVLTIIAIIIQTIFFTPDRKEINYAKATAQAEVYARQTAETNEQLKKREADQQYNIAFARHLAELSNSAKDQQLSILLAIESLKHGISTEGYQAIITSLTSFPQSIREINLDVFGAQSDIQPDFSPHMPINSVDVIDRLRYDSELNWVIKPSITYTEENTNLLLSIYRWKPENWDATNTLTRTIPSIGRYGFGTNVFKTLQFSTNGRFCAYYDGKNIVLWDVISNVDVLNYKSPEISAIRFNSDSTRLMIARTDGQIKLWDIKKSKELYLVNSNHVIKNAEFSPDGNFVALQIEGNNANETNLLIYKFGIREPIYNLQNMLLLGFSDDSQNISLLSIKKDEILQDYERYDFSLLNLNNAESLISLYGNRYLSFLPDSKEVLTLSEDHKTLRIINITNGEKVSQFNYSDTCGGLQSLSFNHDGSMIASSCNNGDLFLWKTSTGEILLTLHLSYVPDTILFFPNDEKFITASLSSLPITNVHSNQVNIWNIKDGKPAGQIIHGNLSEKTGYSNKLTGSILIDPSSNWVITTDNPQSKLRIIDVSNNWSNQVAKYVHDQPGLPGSVNNNWSYAFSVFSPTESKIVISGGNGNVEIWNYFTNQQLFDIPPSNEVAETTEKMIISQDGKWVATTGSFCQSPEACPFFSVRIINIETGETKYINLRTPQNLNDPQIVFSPDSNFLAIGWKDGRVYLYKTGKWVKEVVSKKLSSEIRFLDFSSNNLLALALNDGSVKVLSANNNLKELFEYQITEISAISINPGGSILAIGDISGNLQVVEIRTGRVLSKVKFFNTVSFIGFNQDGSFLAASDGDILDIWSPEDANSLYVIQQPTTIGQFSYSPDGSWAITGIQDQFIVMETKNSTEIMRFPSEYLPSISFDNTLFTSWTDTVGTVAIWKWQINNLIAEACSRINRNLSQEEWNKYFSNQTYQETCP